MGKSMKIFDTIVAIIVALALVSVGTMALFDYNLLLTVAFNVNWLYIVFALIATFFGVYALIKFLYAVFKKFR